MATVDCYKVMHDNWPKVRVLAMREINLQETRIQRYLFGMKNLESVITCVPGRPRARESAENAWELDLKKAWRDMSMTDDGSTPTFTFVYHLAAVWLTEWVGSAQAGRFHHGMGVEE
jgi:hypothetical protein